VVTISDLEENPSAVIEAAWRFPLAILNGSARTAYFVPATAREGQIAG
jgi:hypothetical protein